VPFHSAHENVKLDAGCDVLAGCHRELESSAVGYAGGDGHVQRLMEQLGAASVALRARLGPRLAPSTALPAHGAHRNIEWHGSASAGLPIGETNGRPELRGTLVGEERAANAGDSNINRRKVDGHFVGKAAHVVTVVACNDRYRVTAVWTKRASPHDCAGTIGSALGDVNGHEGVPALWRDDAAA
jgi:hypothetical protein